MGRHGGRKKAPEVLHEVAKHFTQIDANNLGLSRLEVAALAITEEYQDKGWHTIPAVAPYFPTDLRFVEIKLSERRNEFRLTRLGRFVVGALREKVKKGKKRGT